MFTRKAIGYFTLATFLLMLALLFQDFQLAVLVFPIASLFFLTNVWSFTEKVEVELDRRIVPSESFGEEDIFVNLRVRNNGTETLGNVEVEEVLPKKRAWLFALLPTGLVRLPRSRARTSDSAAYAPFWPGWWDFCTRLRSWSSARRH